MGTVHQTFTGDAKGLLAELEKLKKQNAALEEKVNKVAQASAGAGRAARSGTNDANRGYGSAIASLREWAAGYVTLSGAITLVNAALEEQAKRAREASKVQSSTATAQQEFFVNLGAVSPEERAKAVAGVEKIRDDVQFASADPLYAATGKALSGTGGNLPQALDIVATSAPLFRHKPEELGDFAGAVGDISKSLGITDSKAVAALIIQVMEKSRLEDLGGMKSAARAAAAGDISVGGETETPEEKMRDVREAAALFSGFSGRMPDPYGEKSATLTAQLVDALAKNAPDGVDTIMERVQHARDNAEYRAAVMKGRFGAESAFVQELLTGEGGEVGRLANSALTGMTGDKNAYTNLKEAIEGGTSQITNKTTGESLTGTITDFLNTNDALARDANARKAVFGDGQTMGALEATRGMGDYIGSLGGRWQKMQYQLQLAQGYEPEEIAIGLLKSQRSANSTFNDPGKVALLDEQIKILQRSLDGIAKKTEQSGRVVRQAVGAKGGVAKNDERR